MHGEVANFSDHNATRIVKLFQRDIAVLSEELRGVCVYFPCHIDIAVLRSHCYTRSLDVLGQEIALSIGFDDHVTFEGSFRDDIAESGSQFDLTGTQFLHPNITSLGIDANRSQFVDDMAV